MKAPVSLPRKPFVTWIVVADGRRAHIYRRHREEKYIPMPGVGRHHHYEHQYATVLVSVLPKSWEAESFQDYDFGRDQLGRVFESASPTRHMVAPRIDVQEEIKLNFMRTIAGRLQQEYDRKVFEKLVLVAPPKMLGTLKRCLTPALLECIVAELGKDLTHYPRNELAMQLRKVTLHS